MDNFDKIKNDIKNLTEAKFKIVAQAKAQGRELTRKEEILVSELDSGIQAFHDELERPQGAETVKGNKVLSNYAGGGDGPFKNLGEQLLCIKEAARPGGRVDDRLYKVHDLYNAASGLNETTPSEGGFLIQPSLSTGILQTAYDYGQVAKRCRRQPVGANANGIKINGVDETSRADGSRFGGVLGYWLAEADEKTKSKPKFRQIDLELKKQAVLIYTTDELMADAVALDAFIRDAAPKEIAFRTQDAIINGTGAGMPLGVLNSGCLVTVSKESGQAADTIVAQNIINMVKRTLGRSGNYAWFYNKSILDQVYSLSLAVGTGGVPLFMAGGAIPNQPENRLLGLPMIEIEQASALGDLGDIILADFGNGYILADKGGVKADMSIHVQFIYDESVFRFVYRVDGQPALASSVTPFKGGSSATQSYFITLAERA